VPDAIVEFIVFRNHHGRFAYIPTPNVCERCGNKNAGNPDEGSHAAPRYSHVAGKVLTLCARCSY
jgi:hypothetical protein